MKIKINFLTIFVFLVILLVIVGSLFFYYNTLKVPSNIAEKCKFELEQEEVNPNYYYGYKFIADSNNVYYRFDKTKIVEINGDKTRSVEVNVDTGGLSGPFFYDGCVAGDNLYCIGQVLFPEGYVNQIFKISKNLDSYEHINFDYFDDKIIYGNIVADGNSVYCSVEYLVDSKAFYQIIKICDDDLDIVYSGKSKYELLAVKKSVLYLKELDLEKVYSYEIKEQKFKKIKFSLFQIPGFGSFYSIEDLELIDDNLMKIFLLNRDSTYDIEGEKQMYVVDIKTGRKCRIQ